MIIIEPLVRAFASGEAVAFIGSGASTSSGLPDWRTFLTELLEFAESLDDGGPDTVKGGWRRTRELLLGGDFLQAAEMLERELPKRVFTNYVQRVFGAAVEPTDIHRSIARLPFSLILTTNFDVLLEAAYRTPASFTWRDTDAIFNTIRSKRFAIVKLHGSVNDVESVRLTRTHYRDSTFTNPEFNECLRTLLTWKTLLFVGYSLRDSDLLHLVDETRLRFGKKFGPHYAIMPAHEVDDKFRAYLKDAFAIEVIEYDALPDKRDQATAKVTAILRDLSGRVARASFEMGGVPGSRPSTTRSQAAQSILEAAVILSGSHRGDVSFVADDTNPQLQRVANYPPVKSGQALPPISADSITSTIFLQANANISKDYIYLRNVQEAKADLIANGYSNSRYVACDLDVWSELAYPIIADGRRVGTLNLESNVCDAYAEGHVYVARRITEELGRVYIQSERRRMRAAPLLRFYREPANFDALLRKSRLIRSLGHKFILYEIDHEAKQLVAHCAYGTRSFSYGFDTKSLAVKAFMDRNAIYVEDAAKELALSAALRTSWLNEAGVEEFDISGPVFACPVRLGGQTEAILVTWTEPSIRKLPHDITTPLYELFRSSCRQVSRLADLVVNDRLGTDRLSAEWFLGELYGRLGKIDHGKVWSRSNLTNSVFRAGILQALLESVIAERTGLKRVRVWRATVSTSKDGGSGALPQAVDFQCVRSLTCSGYTAAGKQECDAYLGCRADASDLYCRYTVSRYAHDPFARWQHPAMFGSPDPNSSRLDKDPSGSWIVAPIVRKGRLLGFISADNHRQSGGPKQAGDPDFREIAQQCRLMNVISDLAQYVLPRVPQV
jgi:NAD-dependent SIR2 family protein deacetylase